MTRKLITPAVLAQKPPASGRMETKDTLSPLAFRITAAGARSFTVRVRVKGQRQPIRLTFEKPPHPSTLTEAREWAVRLTGLCRQGTDPRLAARVAKATAEAAKVDAEQSRFEIVAERFLATNGVFKKNSRPWKPRTLDEYRRNLNRPIARWRGRNIHTITRDEISDFLAEVAESAPIAANRLLAVLSGMMNWWQTQRGSNFTNPIIRGMAPAEERSRDRVLSDDELRVIWRIAGRNGTYGAIIQTLLLTGARKSEVAAMRHSMIKDGVWELPGAMTKNHEQLSLSLPKAALDLIGSQPRADDQDLVFSLDAEHVFQNWGKSKAEFDLRCLRRIKAAARAAGSDPAEVKAFPNWRLHDLRRTARSLMSRAGVPSEHAERVLNHKQAGIVGVYDRYRYELEKGRALEALAALLDRIVHPAPSNVVPIVRVAAE
jgi:integrase